MTLPRALSSLLAAVRRTRSAAPGGGVRATAGILRRLGRARGRLLPSRRLEAVTPLRPRDLFLVVLGAQPCDEFVELVAGCAARRSSQVFVCRPVELPDVLPLNARLPQAEDDSFLERLRGPLAAKGIRVATEVVRSRDAGEALLELARALRPRLILLNGVRTARGGLSREARCLLRDPDGAHVVMFDG